jgi:hypothetical protein
MRQKTPCALMRWLGVAAATVVLAFPAGAQIGVPTPRPAETESRIGVGYSANVPNQFAGVSGHYLGRALGGFGIYVDAKFDLESPRDDPGWTDTLTARDVEDRIGDRLFARDGSWTSVNVALMRSFGPQTAVYLGAGYADGTEFRQYEDETGERGFFGTYWVLDEEASRARLNVLGGVFLQMGRNFAAQFGAESAPGGFTVGLSYLIPLR